MSRAGVLVLLSAAAIACADLGDLLALQQGIATEFKAPAVSVNVSNRRHLTVTFANSATDELPDSARAALARRVAEFVRDHYAAYGRLEEISVGFARVKRSGPITFRASRMPYTFRTAQLGTARDSLRAAVTP